MSPTKIISYLSIMCYGLCITIIGPALKVVGADFSLTPGQLGLFTTALSMGLIPAVLFGGYVYDRYNTKVVGITGQALLTAGFFLFAVSPSFSVALPAFFIMGAAGGIIEIVTNNVVSYSNPEKRAAALNLLHAFFGIGALLGPILSGGLIDSGADWRMIYRIVGGLSAAVTVLFFFSPFPKHTSAEKVDFASLYRIIKNPTALLFGLIIILYVGSEMGITYWSVLYLSQRHGLSTLGAGSFLTYFWLAITVGRLVVFTIAKRIKGRLLLLILIGLSLVSYALFLTAGTGWLAAVALAFVGFFFSGIFPTALGLGVNEFSRIPGTITGFLMTFMGGGMLIFPYVVGVIAEAYSLSVGMIFILAILICLMLVATVAVLKKKNAATINGAA